MSRTTTNLIAALSEYLDQHDRMQRHAHETLDLILSILQNSTSDIPPELLAELEKAHAKTAALQAALDSNP